MKSCREIKRGEVASTWTSAITRLSFSSDSHAAVLQSSLVDAYHKGFKLPTTREKETKKASKIRRKMLKGPERAKKENFKFYHSQFHCHEIEHKWKQFIVYASSNHLSHIYLRQSQNLRRGKKRKKRYQKCISSIVFRKKNCNNVNVSLWIALPPEGDREGISNCWFRSIGWKIEPDFIMLLPFSNDFFPSYLRDASKSQFVAHEKQTKRGTRGDQVQHDTLNGAKGYECTWLQKSQINALWLSFKMANECTQKICRTCKRRKR